jgi:hypothetical protein
MGLTLTSIISHGPARRGYSFTDSHTVPGDRLDAELDRLYQAVRDLQSVLAATFSADGTIARHAITLDMIDPDVLAHIKRACTPDLSRHLAQTHAAAGNALAQADQARSAATRAFEALRESVGLRDQAREATERAVQTGAELDQRLTAAEQEEIDASNFANDAEESANQAKRSELLSGAWAEYLEGNNPIPAMFFAETEITGQHWSSRWWATQAAAALGGFFQLYLGAWPEPPTTTFNGDPIPIGAIYYNTVSQQVFIWDGQEWKPFYAPTKSLMLTLIYRATAGQTVFDLTDLDLKGESFVMSGADPEPLDAYLNGVRVPRDAPVAGTGDWDVDPETSIVTFNQPLAAGTLFQVDILVPASRLPPSRVVTQQLLDFNIDPATGLPGQVDGVRTSFPLVLATAGHEVVTVTQAVELFICVDGVVQQPGTDYNVSADHVVFGEAPLAGARAWGIWYGPGTPVVTTTTTTVTTTEPPGAVR